VIRSIVFRRDPFIFPQFKYYLSVDSAAALALKFVLVHCPRSRAA
jgi:hypothetical protein